MQKNPLLSVIVTIYNVAPFLGECIESIITQTYRNLEIILVEDGATDRSPQICDFYAKKDERIRVIHKCNEGLVAARKTGVLASGGSLVAYVDGDDWINADYFEKMIEVFERNQADIVLGGCIKETEVKQLVMLNNLEQGYYSKSRLEKEIYPRMLYTGEFYKFGVQQYLWNKLYKRELLIPWQIKVEEKINNGEDIACLYPMLLNAQSIEITGICGYHYRIHEGAMTAKLNEDYPKGINDLYDYLREAFHNSIYENMMKRQLMAYYTYLVTMSAKYVLGMKMVPESFYRYQFPFDEIAAGCSVLVVAQGRMGKDYALQLQRTSIYKKTKCVLIDNFEDIQKSISEILEDGYDYIVLGGEKIAGVMIDLMEELSMKVNCPIVWKNE